IVLSAEIAAGQHPGAMHRRRLDHDHRSPAPGAFAVVAEMALRRQPLDAHVGRMRAEDEAMLQRLMAQGERLEDVRISLRGHGGLAKGKLARDLRGARTRAPCTIGSRKRRASAVYRDGEKRDAAAGWVGGGPAAANAPGDEGAGAIFAEACAAANLDMRLLW